MGCPSWPLVWVTSLSVLASCDAGSGDDGAADVSTARVATTTTELVSAQPPEGELTGGLDGTIIYARVIPPGEPRDDALIDGSVSVVAGCWLVNDRFPVVWPFGTEAVDEGVRLSSGVTLAPGETFSLPGTYLKFGSEDLYLTDAAALGALSACDLGGTGQFSIVFP